MMRWTDCDVMLALAAIQFEATINLGHVISLVTMLIALMATAFRLFRCLDKMQWQIGMMWRWFSKEHNIDPDSGK